MNGIARFQWMYIFIGWEDQFNMVHKFLRVYDLWKLFESKLDIYEFVRGTELKVWVWKGGKVYIVLIIDILM